MPNPHWGKYDALACYLGVLAAPTVQLRFVELGALLGDTLPPSAQQHRAWWANSWNTPKGRAWLRVGWRLVAVNWVLREGCQELLRWQAARGPDPALQLC